MAVVGHSGPSRPDSGSGHARYTAHHAAARSSLSAPASSTLHELVPLLWNDDDIRLETGAPNVSQQFHHIRIANVLIASQKNYAFRIGPRRSDGFDLGFEFGRRDQGVAQIQFDSRITAASGSLD
jgi:hypothetical protein